MRTLTLLLLVGTVGCGGTLVPIAGGLSASHCNGFRAASNTMFGVAAASTALATGGGLAASDSAVETGLGRGATEGFAAGASVAGAVAGVATAFGYGFDRVVHADCVEQRSSGAP